jgi:hypothetical protein
MTRALPDQDDPITLDEAAEIVFRGAITVASLRAERDRKELVTFRVGRQDFTTLRLVREMQERKCRAQSPPLASGSILSAKLGQSSTAVSPSARAAARATFKALKKSSKPTSRTLTS